ncbi:AIG1 family protein [Entamoeba histolytica KU27]|uniref:AIG1 family protein n=1 Tax=Entamoeba histolytica KU27 TaxID=885311 RepID=M2R1N4_ENTHI|nr:AIG1 family protein [Entamoeba histolytica KU27]
MSVPTNIEGKKTKLLLIGGTGDGKSSLGNFILKKNAFDVNDNPNPVVKPTMGCYGEDDRSDIFVIDTPGFNDSEGGRDKDRQWNQMISYIKEQEEIEAIVIVFNFTNAKPLYNFTATIKMICKIFPISDFWEHVCIVWTRCYCCTPEKKLVRQIESRKEKFLLEFEKLAKETTGDEIIKIPMFYVDSCPDEDDDNSRSEEEIEMLLTWACSLLPINVERVVKNGLENEKIVIEEKEYTEVVEVKNGFVKLKTEYMRREKRIRYDGSVTYSDWELTKTKYKIKPISRIIEKYINYD